MSAIQIFLLALTIISLVLMTFSVLTVHAHLNRAGRVRIEKSLLIETAIEMVVIFLFILSLTQGW